MGSKRISETEAENHSCFLLFSTTSSWLSRSIRWATRSEVSHVAIAFECSTTSRVLVMEAAGDGFRGLTWERWQQENELIRAFRIEVPTSQWREGLGEFCDMLGSPYDTPRLFREAARHISQGWTQRFAWADPERNTKGVLCADAIADFLHRIGFTQYEHPLAWTPAKLLANVDTQDAFAPMSTRVRTMPFRRISSPAIPPMSQPASHQLTVVG